MSLANSVPALQITYEISCQPIARATSASTLVILSHILKAVDSQIHRHCQIDSFDALAKLIGDSRNRRCIDGRAYGAVVDRDLDNDDQ